VKRLNSTAILIILLVLVSLAFYAFQLIQFESPRDTAFYLLQDLAFLPLQVAIVTIVLGKILNAREKRERLKKTNMMVSAFFSEIGTDLMRYLIRCSTTAEELRPILKIKGEVGQGLSKSGLHRRQMRSGCTLYAFRPGGIKSSAGGKARL
jgi:uncharacterized membrane protein YozB (DUF420 family)